MKKFVKYLVLCIPLLSFGLKDVNAASVVDYSKLSFTQSAQFANCTSNNNCSLVGTTHSTSSRNNNVIDLWGSSSQLTTVANSSGIGLSFYADEGFIKGNVYTVSILVDIGNSTSYTTNTKKVGVGTSLSNALSNATGYIEGYDGNNLDVNVYGSVISDFGFSYLSYTFKASNTGNFIFLTMNTKANATQYWHLYGYSVIDHGSQAPSTDDIKNSLNSSFTDVNNSINNAQNSINNNINNVNQNINEVNNNINSVNDNINDLKENVDNTLNSEDEDIESSKCGIVCKLRGVFTAIANLPLQIWEKLKAGFEAITGAIGEFCDSIIKIFLPEGECTKSANLFDYKQDPYVGKSFLTGTVSLIENGFTLETSKVSYYLGKSSDLYGKTFSFSFDLVGDGSFSFGYLNSMWSTSIEFTTSSTLTINQSGEYDVYLYFKGTGATFSNFMLVEGNTPVEYMPFGEEVCTETSFFGWFERFGQIIKGFFDTLLGGILDGLKSLFVPTDEQLLDIIDKSKDLSENFGFVGQSINFFLNIFTSLLGLVNANGCVQLPEMTIGATSLFDSHTFWNSQLVCLNDNKILADNIETIRTITSIALVCMFVNFASRKFFEILSKNEAPEQSEAMRK